MVRGCLCVQVLSLPQSYQNEGYARPQTSMPPSCTPLLPRHHEDRLTGLHDDGRLCSEVGGRCVSSLSKLHPINAAVPCLLRWLLGAAAACSWH